MNAQQKAILEEIVRLRRQGRGPAAAKKLSSISSPMAKGAAKMMMRTRAGKAAVAVLAAIALGGAAVMNAVAADKSDSAAAAGGEKTSVDGKKSAKTDGQSKALEADLLVTVGKEKGFVCVLDGKTREIKWRSDDLRWPECAVRLKDGRIAVSEYGKDRILIISLQGKVLGEAKVVQPKGIKQLANGNLLVAAHWGLFEIALDGKVVKTDKKYSRHGRLVDFVIMPDDSRIVLYSAYAGYNAKRVGVAQRIDAEGKEIWRGGEWQYKKAEKKFVRVYHDAQRISYSPAEDAVYITLYRNTIHWPEKRPGEIYRISAKDGTVLWKGNITFAQEIIKTANKTFLVATRSAFGAIGEYKDKGGEPGEAIWRKDFPYVADVEILDEPFPADTAVAALKPLRAPKLPPGGIEKIPEANLELYVDRPRLLFRKTELPRLQELCQGDYFTIFKEMKQVADDYLPVFAKICKTFPVQRSVPGDRHRQASMAMTYGLLYQLTHEDKYLDALKNYLKWHELLQTAGPDWTLEFPFYVYDLVWEGLTPGEREKFHYILMRLDSILQRHLNIPTFTGLPHGAGAWHRTFLLMSLYRDGVDGGALDGEAKKWIVWTKKNLIPHYKEMCKWRGGGGIFEGDSCPCSWRKNPVFLEAWRNMTGENLFAEPAIAGYVTWTVSQFMPAWSGLAEERQNILGFCRRLQLAGEHEGFHLGMTPGRGGAIRDSSLLIAGKGKWGLAQWLGNVPAGGSYSNLKKWKRSERDTGNIKTAQQWYKMKRDIKNKKGLGWEGYARWGYGWKTILGWYDPDLKPIHPRELPETLFFEGNGHVSMRSSWEPGATFAYFKCGVNHHQANHLNNNNFVIFKQGDLAPDGCYSHKLMAKTAEHSTVTVYDERFKGQRRPYNYKRFGYDGGQVNKLMQYGKVPGLYKKEHIGKFQRDGEILAFETSPEFDYVCGSAGKSYDERTVTYFYRQFVYIKPDYFVVFDRIGSADEKPVKRWILQALMEPRIEKNRFQYDAYPAGAGGRLFGITLLPKEINIEKEGGEEKKWERRGYASAWLKESYPWRIYVSPKNKSRDDTFLHVLQAADVKTEKMVPARLIEERETAGAEIRIGDRIWRVMFAKTGKPAGHLTVRELAKGDATAKKVIDWPLAAKIEDTYKRWKSDCRYEAWITDKRFRFVIPETGR